MNDIPVHSPLQSSQASPESEDPESDSPQPGETDPGTVDLAEDPFRDDLAAELAAATPKRWTNRATYIIGALALLMGGFLAGVQVEKHYGNGGHGHGYARPDHR